MPPKKNPPKTATPDPRSQSPEEHPIDDPPADDPVNDDPLADKPDDNVNPDDTHEFQEQTTASLAEAIILMTQELRRREPPASKAKSKEPDTFDGSDPRSSTTSSSYATSIFVIAPLIPTTRTK